MKNPNKERHTKNGGNMKDKYEEKQTLLPSGD